MRSSVQRDPVGQSGLAFVLGAVETNLLDLTNAYATLGRKGVRRNLRYFPDDPIVDASILDPEVCAWLGAELSSWRLPSSVFENTTSDSIPWFMRKTGTSSGRRDAWTIGHNGKHAVGVWVGRLSGMGDQAFVGSRAAEPLLAKIFNLPCIRRTDAPPAPAPWTVDDPIPFPEKSVLSIQRPESGSVYRRVGESFEIRPKANLGGELLWFLNGRPLCTQEAKRTMVGSGSYELLCLSPTGEHALFSIPGLLGRFQTEGPTGFIHKQLGTCPEGKDGMEGVKEVMGKQASRTKSKEAPAPSQIG